MNNLIFFLIYSSLRGPKMPIRNSQNGPKIFQISHRELETDKICSKNRCKSRFYPRSVHTSLKIEVSSTFPPVFPPIFVGVSLGMLLRGGENSNYLNGSGRFFHISIGSSKTGMRGRKKSGKRPERGRKNREKPL